MFTLYANNDYQLLLEIFLNTESGSYQIKWKILERRPLSDGKVDRVTCCGVESLIFVVVLGNPLPIPL
jgi:hypothetical protein